MQAYVHEFQVFEDGSARLMARVVGLDSQRLVQSDFGSIAWQSWATLKPATEVGSGTLEPADVIFNSLQTESWTKDSTGYNFRWDMPSGTFPDPKRYQLAIKFTLNDSPPTVLPLVVEANALRTAPG